MAVGSAAHGQAAPPASVAGSTVTNVAAADLLVDGAPAHLSSNAATFRVDELLDIRLTSATGTAVPTGAPINAVPFLLVNSGNGNEAFLLDLRVDGSAAVPQGFALDRDGNGLFDPAVDLPIAIGAATPVLASGETAPLLALLRGDGGAAGTLVIRAHAVTGSGVPGTTFTGLGDGGTDAVVGGTTAAAEIRLPFAPGGGAGGSVLSFVKSQTVRAADGSATPIRGATVTYTLEARLGGSGTVRAVRIADPVPPGTAYVPGSLRLDEQPLTDPDDGDAGRFDGAGISIALGDVAAPATRNIRFQVVIQ